MDPKPAGNLSRSANLAVTAGVSTMDGATQATVISSGASSRARPVVRPWTPPLAALYIAWSASPLRTDSAPTFTMRPPPCARSGPMAARVQWIVRAVEDLPEP